MDRLSTPGEHPHGGEELPLVADAATAVGPARRWVADPLPLLLAVGAAGLVVAALALSGALTGTVGWLVPALFGVVVAGLALSGST